MVWFDSMDKKVAGLLHMYFFRLLIPADFAAGAVGEELSLSK
jgi:hypothetical protein